ncbi:MAG: DUF262 domain-containing protein [Flavobacteriales bacterium]|jgi:uncharacterized protein with ParB-like and HNH nuclease domain
MATTNLLDTKTFTFNEILGNGKIYHVPQFQRDYSWEQDHLDDLWNDLISTYTRNEAHYMGSIVLQIKDDPSQKQFWVIDGQQRFTTLSLLSLAIIHKIRTLANDGIDREANEERAELLMKQYIGQKDPSSLMYSSKLFLNENNDGFYQSRLLTFREPVNYSKLIDSDKLLWDAYQFFVRNIQELFKNETSGERIASFLTRTIGELLKFIQITVVDELNAYTVFETLNSRGVELTSTDLLKNYLFSLVAKSQNDLQAVKQQWQKIINAVGLRDFPVFLRYYLNARSSLVTKDSLFKSIKKMVTRDQDVLDILDHLEKYSYTYNALFNAEDEMWLNDREVREYVNSLNLFRVTLCHPLLMAAYEKLSFQEFKKVLRVIVNISFRYNVIGKLQTNELERAYNTTSNKIYNGTLKDASAVADDLKSVYLSDDMFRSYFELKSFNTSNSQQKKIARYILYKIEGQIANGIKTDYLVDDGSIEHVLPESMSEHWKGLFSEEEHNQVVYLLGNLTLLEPKLNSKEAGQRPFAEKKEVYAKSKYALSQAVEADEWSIRAIKHRQASLGKTAAGIWRI